MRILTAGQMQAADRHAIDELGMPSLVLMENAGAEVVGAIEDALGDPADLCVLVLCGTGNNGGDGMVVTRRLHARGADVRALLLGDPGKLSKDAALQWNLLQRLGIVAETCDAEEWDEEVLHLASHDVIVDALLGTGFRGRAEDLLATVIEDVNSCPIPVVAVDIPSGLSGSSSAIEGPAIEAAFTVTFAAPKVCHVFAPAHELCGDVVVAEMGIPDSSIASAGSELELIEEDAVSALLEPLAHRPDDAHKGDVGHVLVVGGTLTHSGAVALAGLGALAGGAGLVTVASPAPCVPIVASHAPELMHVALPADAAGETADAPVDVDALLHRKSVVVIGPGLGTGAGAARLLAAILEKASVPVVVDADALNLLAAHGLPHARPDRPLVLTPHPGELERLHAGLGLPAPGEDQLSRIETARALAARAGGVVVVKGFRTLVVGSAGVVHVNPTGGPGMATGGSGDVLSGILGALMAQELPPAYAAVAAVFVHGRAGDLAEEGAGQMSMTAGDLVRFLPQAISSVLGEDDDE